MVARTPYEGLTVLELADDPSGEMTGLQFVNLGADSGAAPGDMYTIYRANVGNKPPLVLGELAVLSVSTRGSVARILTSRYPIYVGDKLEPK